MNLFTIIADRCSGNHFAKFSLLRNFNISYSPEFSSHFFTDDLILDKHTNLDNTLFICIVRHPLDWIDSFFKRLHHIPPVNKISINAFITNEFYSIYEEGANIHQEIMEDRHMCSKERYKNIFEMRYVKYMWMLHKLPQMVKNHIIIPYEMLRDHYDETLEFLEKKYNLMRKHPEFIKVPQYKGTYNYDFTTKPVIIKPDIQEKILLSVCPLLEAKIGYNIPISTLQYNMTDKHFIPYKYEYFLNNSNIELPITKRSVLNFMDHEAPFVNTSHDLENKNIIDVNMSQIIIDNITTNNTLYSNIKLGNTDESINLFLDTHPCVLQTTEKINYKNFISNIQSRPVNYSPSFNRMIDNYKLQ